MQISAMIGRAGLSAVFLIGCVACGKNDSPQEIREKTAAATAELKQNARAVAQGVREGWSRDKPLDINKAAKYQLQDLPGINSARADQIIAGRPYDDPHQLVTRRIVTETEYGKISEKVVARH
jgi:DNA uptake protein ComE-like DNA-binding protein